MRKILTIIAVILFSFTLVGGSVFILADLPAAVQEVSENSGGGLRPMMK